MSGVSASAIDLEVVAGAERAPRALAARSTWTSSSAFACSTARRISPGIASLIAFSRSGRFSVMRATPVVLVVRQRAIGHDTLPARASTRCAAFTIGPSTILPSILDDVAARAPRSAATMPLRRGRSRRAVGVKTSRIGGDLLRMDRELAGETQRPAPSRSRSAAPTSSSRSEVRHVDQRRARARGRLDEARPAVEERLPRELGAQIDGEVRAAEGEHAHARIGVARSPWRRPGRAPIRSCR